MCNTGTDSVSYNCILLISWNKRHKNTRVTRSYSVQGHQVESPGQHEGQHRNKACRLRSS